MDRLVEGWRPKYKIVSGESERACKNQPDITALRAPNGELVTGQEDLEVLATDFYKDFHSPT
jgi:hypothetical protein